MRTCRLICWILMVLLFPCLIPAEQASPPPATLSFQNREITTFRVTVVQLTPAQRADGAYKRLRALSGTSLYEPVKVESIPDGSLFIVDKKLLFAVVKGDLEPGSDLQAETRAVQGRLSNALRAQAEQTSVPMRIRATLLSLAGTIVFLLLLKLLFVLRRKLLSALTSKTEKQARLVIFGYDLRGGAVRLLEILARAFLIASFLFLLYTYVTFVLNRFPYTRPWGLAARGFLLHILQTFASKSVDAFPGVLSVLIILAIARLITRAIHSVFSGVAKGTVHMPGVYGETADATRRLINTVIWLLALVIAYPYIPGGQSDAFKGVSVFMGILFTLGSAGVVGHLMSGLVLVYSRALKKGDFVRVGEVEGVVLEMGPLSTKIVNLKKEEFTLPNTMMVSSVIKNYTRQSEPNGLGVSTTLTIGYDAPWRKVHELLLFAAEQTEGVRKDPKPFVFQTALSDFYVEYQLYVYLDPYKRRATLSMLHQNIQDAFNAEGIQIMSPHYEGQPEKPVLVPASKWFPKDWTPGEP